MTSSPETPNSSDLSDPPSDDFDDHDSTVDVSSRQSVERVDSDVVAPPAKRRRTGNGGARRWPYERAPSLPADDAVELLSVSEDSFGSAPGSPSHDEWTVRDDAQVECLWRDCDFGKAVNNDELVQHVQSTHCATGGPKKTKYVCEWGECQNKTSNHPSGYALKAHMRSHTKEKPYYCALPECDKAFTRSDALAKHMRTVHEPEQTRAGPGTTGTLEPPSMAKKPVKLKLNNGSREPARFLGNPIDYVPDKDKAGNDIDPSVPSENITYVPAHHPQTGQPGFMIHYPPDVHFSSYESLIQADQLWRLLRRQLKWAQDEGKELDDIVEGLEADRKKEWIQKEALLKALIDLDSKKVSKYRKQQADLPDGPQLVELPDDRAENGVLKRRKPVLVRKSRGKDLVKEEPDDVAALRDADPAEDGDADGDADLEPETSPARADGEGGFDGADDPYDNYLQGLLKRYNKHDSIAEADADDAGSPEP